MIYQDAPRVPSYYHPWFHMKKVQGGTSLCASVAGWRWREQFHSRSSRCTETRIPLTRMLSANRPVAKLRVPSRGEGPSQAKLSATPDTFLAGPKPYGNTFLATGWQLTRDAGPHGPHLGTVHLGPLPGLGALPSTHCSSGCTG